MSARSRRDFAKTLAGAAVAAPYFSCSSKSGASVGKKVVVLGLDGMDPKILRGLMEQGRAPNFSKLAARGSFQPLGTTMPALSPVAWSTFITGMNPGGHGIPDFIARDPLTYTPFFSIWEPRDADRTISLGDYELPISGGEPANLRRGKPFWSYLTERDIPATVIKIPTNFPVDETATRAIAGMGTPDLTDSFGVFTYYTSDFAEEHGDMSGGEMIRIRVQPDGRVETHLPGPENTIRKSVQGRVEAPFTIDRDPDADVVRIDLQDQALVLKKGEYSDWIKVSFELAPMVVSVSGIARFYVKDVHPHLRLYVTPINIDPENQAMPITYPVELGGEIASHIGPFWTKGLPADTKAFDYGIINDEGYVKQAELIFKERMALFDYEWSQFREGLFYFYVSSTDQDAHMLWRNMDKTHPMHSASDPRFGSWIPHIYEECDKLVGHMLEAADDDCLVLVCSDHGFASFGRQFHLNTWLRDNGYLKIRASAARKETANIFDIDWNETVAYGVGFNGLYFNRLGREEHGIVDDAKASELAARLRRELEAISDSETGEHPVAKVFERAEVYSGEMAGTMPDLLVGYQPGYRCASSSVVGETGKAIIDINPWAWGGDHSMARHLVPGTLLASRSVTAAEPNIIDLPVTILDFFGVDRPEHMEGRTLL